MSMYQSSSGIAIIVMLKLFLFALTPNFVLVVASNTMSIESDKEALIAFRSQLSLDPSNTIASWNENSSPCNWTRVVCNKFGHRVIDLNLSSLELGGSISPYIGNLTFLQSLRLQNNQLMGAIPIELCNLLRLKILNLSSNNLEGSIPSNINKLRELKVMDLTMNKITGRIPREVSLLRKLQVLNLGRNQLTGPIPPSISNISSLTNIDFGTNMLNGPIPSELRHLRSLKHLDLTINNLTGIVPPAIYNMSSLVFLALASNHLWGELPCNVGETLPNLLVFNFCINKFTGRIPGSLHNLSNIQVIRMAHNHLTGTIPPGLGNLPFLKMYNIGYNKIVSSGDDSLDFLTSLANSTQLNFLAFDGNQIELSIPESIGNLSKVLSKLYMGQNRIHGSIPSSISQLTGLALLNMSYNEISGPIPCEISRLQNLQVLDLAKNHISGAIPDSMGSLIKLDKLDLSDNNLVGQVPHTFGGFSALSTLDLSSNKLNGSIPEETLTIPISNFLNLSNNQFKGELPQEIGLLQTGIAIDLSNNLLSGNIPSSVSNCKSLQMLNMSRNSFSGPIPSSLGNLKALGTLDLSSNQLSGIIPSGLRFLNATQYLNLSFNQLEGGLPCGGLFRNLSGVYLQGNPKLSLQLACQKAQNARHTLSLNKVETILIIVAALVFCLTIASFLYAIRKRKAKLSRTTDSNMIQYQLVKYDELRQATEDFSERNLIGRGSFGSVYKGLLKDNVVVAIKVLDMHLDASWKSFSAECEALRNVRHRNLVKLLTSCSSLDCKNMEFLALVYEYLSNGNLEDWISGKRKKENGSTLELEERLNVIIDVACALDYIHHDSEAPIVHCDLKPSNILLDEDMTAKIGDFGLARLLMEKRDDHHSISSNHALKGSIGYLPPEYGLGVRPSVAGDTYSFGVSLLELFTGKSPSHESFTGEENLVTWVQACFPSQVMQLLVDPKLHQLHQPEDQGFNHPEKYTDCLVSVIEIGLSCTVDRPDHRVSMREALRKLKAVRSKFLKV